MLTIYSDGGSRGNPGKSAYAIVVTENNKIIFEKSEFLGINTNNYAEYRGLIAGITKALELKATDVEFVMDSQLVIRQMNGEYKVKSENIRELHKDAKALSSLIPKVKFTHVLRENEFVSRADALLNEEMDRNQDLLLKTMIASDGFVCMICIIQSWFKNDPEIHTHEDVGKELGFL